MPWVRSEAVRRISWDRQTSTLFVQFVDGDTYAYLGVPEAVYADFLAADSKGAFFASAIRNRYPHRKLARSAA